MLFFSKHQSAQTVSSFFISHDHTKSPDFQTINNALYFLDTNTQPLGHVVLELDDGLYNEYLRLNYPELTIKSKYGDSSKVIIKSSSEQSIVVAAGISLKLENITIAKYYKSIPAHITDPSTLIWIKSLACTVNISNCIFKADSIDYSIFASMTTVSYYHENFCFFNNSFEKGNYGIFLWSWNNKFDTICIQQNRFINQNQGAINLKASRQCILHNNYIQSFSDLPFSGLELVNTPGEITNNQFSCTGSYANTAIKIEEGDYKIGGNYIYIRNAYDANTGIHIQAGDGLSILNNTVKIFGDTAFSSIPLSINASENVEVQNNILFNATDDHCFYGDDNVFSKLDHNCYFNDNGRPIYVIDTAGKLFNPLNLTNWTSQSGFDSNSLYIDPLFYNDLDFHIYNPLLNNAGAQSNISLFDLDGQTRDTLSPDIGVDEFTPNKNDVGIYQLNFNKDDISCQHIDSLLYEVQIINTSLDTIRQLTLEINLDSSPVSYEPVKDTIEPGDTLIYKSQKKYFIGDPEWHRFHIQTSQPGDTNTINNALSRDLKTIWIIDSFPFTEDFERGYDLTFYTFSYEDASINVDKRAANKSNYGLHLDGGGWFNWTTDPAGLTQTNIWEDNESHHTYAHSCKIYPGSTSNLRLRFDLRQTYSISPELSNLRILINDSIPIADMNGEMVQNPQSNQDDFRTVFYDLNPYLKNAFSLSFQSSCRHADSFYQAGDNIFIDNVVFYTPPEHDVGVISINQPSNAICPKTKDPVIVEISNFGTTTQSFIPVQANIYTKKDTQVIYNNYTRSLLPGETDTFFVGFANTKILGQIQFEAFTNLPKDTAGFLKDTAYSLIHFLPNKAIPFIDSFEIEDSVYANWVLDTAWVSDSGLHGSVSQALSNSIVIEDAKSSNMQTNFKFGPIEQNSVLVFDYRIVKFDYPFNESYLYKSDSFFIMVSNTCGLSFDTLLLVDSSNHLPSVDMRTIQLPLSKYLDDLLILRFYYHSDSFNFNYLDIDNVRIIDKATLDLPHDTSVCPGDSVYVQAYSDSSNYFLWIKLENNDTISDKSSLYLSEKGGYICTTISRKGSFESDTFFLDYHPVPVAEAGNDTTYCYGDTVKLYANPSYNFEWNDSLLNQNPVYVAVNPATYRLKTTNVYGCTDIDTIVVNVRSLPDIKIDTNFSKCRNNEIKITASGGSTYSWNATYNGTEFIYIVKEQNLIRLEGTDLFGCKNQDSFSFYSLPLPAIDLGKDTSLCGQSSIDFKLTKNYEQIEWYNGLHDSIITIDSSGVGLDTITVWARVWENGCPNTDSIQIIFSKCSSIKSTATKNNLLIYPNPNTGQFILDFQHLPLTTKNDILVSISDMQGRILLIQPVRLSGRPELSIELDPSLFGKGVYLIKIQNGTELITKKIIIQ